MSGDILAEKCDLHISHLRKRHNPIHCVVPTYLLDQLARKGTEAQREFVLNTIQLDGSFRSARVGFSEMLGPMRRARRAMRQALGWAALAAAQECVPERTIYDAQNKRRKPGRKVRGEGDPPTGDKAVDEAYDGLGATYDLFCEEYGRDSIDDNGMPLDATVHFGQNYDNAFWDGRQMVFGDGDGEIFNRFTIAVDVMGHELTHGVTEHEAGLIYWKQAGALNEHISDVFGSLVKQYVDEETAEEADWLIGEGIFTNNVQGVALRSMKAPGTAYDDPVLGKDPQPAHMRDYLNTMQDNGGVHINSGIPNKAFYLAAVEIGGSAWDKAGLIWYDTLRSPLLRRNTQFQQFANLTVMTAGQLFGFNSAEANAVRTGWAEVGITVSGVRGLGAWRRAA
jgi:Zn-dependent metalloprotease